MTVHSTGTGVVTAGETSLTMHPKHVPTPLRGVMFVHGAGSSADYCTQPTGNQDTLTERILGHGFVAHSGDNGGPNTWGNATSLARLDANYAYLQSRPDVTDGKVSLVCASMGAAVALNWTRANVEKVACIVAVIPVINVTDIYLNNRGGYAAAIAAAHGGWSEATRGALYNPATIAATGVYADIPMLFYYGTADTLCLPELTEAFASTVGANVELVSLPYGHDFDSYAAVNQPQAAAFVNTHGGAV